MKKLIRKILNEEIHPHYEGLLENPSDAKLSISYTELKIGLFVFKDIVNISDKNLRYQKFLGELVKRFFIQDRDVLSKMLLIFAFNDFSDLKYALKQKSTESLYLGPFYSCQMDFTTEIDEDVEYEDDDCDYCGGSGEDEISCDECGGSGEVEDVDGEYISCDRCDGSGEVTNVCNYCGGSGEEEKEVTIYELNNYTAYIISKEPFDAADYSYASEVFKDGDLLVGKSEWYDSQREYNGTYFNYSEDEIIELDDQDIITKYDVGWVWKHFY